MRQIYFILGWISFALGVIGAFLPIMPTTPFMIVAAYFFSKSSERWHQWLLAQPHIGPSIRDWSDHGVIKKRVKIIVTLLMIPSCMSLFVFDVTKPLVKCIILATIALVLIFIWTRPSEKKEIT